MFTFNFTYKTKPNFLKDQDAMQECVVLLPFGSGQHEVLLCGSI